jgi:hypothetical protein
MATREDGSQGRLLPYNGYHASSVSMPDCLPALPSPPAFRLTPGRVWSTDTPANPCRSGSGPRLLQGCPHHA